MDFHFECFEKCSTTNDTGYKYKDEAMMIRQKDTIEIDGNGKVNHSLTDSSTV